MDREQGMAARQLNKKTLNDNPYGNNESSWEMVKKELSKEDFSETIKNFKVTIDNMMDHMFSGYNG